MINQVSLTGKITNHRVRILPSGLHMATFSIGLGSKKKDGTWDNAWLSCVSFSTSVAALVNSLAPTDKPIVLVQGKLKPNNFTDKSGVERSGIQMVVDEISFYESQPRTAPLASDLEQPLTTFPGSELDLDCPF